MTVAIALPDLTLDDDQARLVALLRGKIRKFAKKNRLKDEYYEAKQRIRHLDIAVPPHLRDMLDMSMGWPGTTVDVLEERLDWLGWTSVKDVMGLDEIFRDNQLAIEGGRAHLDALITGTDFVSVGKGDSDAGEPDVMVAIESASSATMLWNYRRRRADAALSQTRDEHGQVILESLYLPDETILFERNGRTKKLEVVDRDKHDLGRVMMARFVNRDRASDLEGRSEITRPVRYYTDAALRTLLGMEINREFYTAPQWFALNATAEQFGVDPDASPEAKKIAGWKNTMGRMNIVPPNEEGEAEVKIQQTTPSPPTPYIDQMKAYSQLVSAETGIPSSYLGFVTDNPASADSIRQLEYRLVKRAERRQTTFGIGWREVGYLALLVRDGAVDRDKFRNIDVKWRDASTPTRAASADEALKLVSSEILTSDSEITYDRIGLSQQDQAKITEEKRRQRAADLPNRLREAASQVTDSTVVNLANRRVAEDTENAADA